jgi:hypothetical protein
VTTVTAFEFFGQDFSRALVGWVERSGNFTILHNLIYFSPRLSVIEQNLLSVKFCTRFFYTNCLGVLSMQSACGVDSGDCLGFKVSVLLANKV